MVKMAMTGDALTDIDNLLTRVEELEHELIAIKTLHEHEINEMREVLLKRTDTELTVIEDINNGELLELKEQLTVAIECQALVTTKYDETLYHLKCLVDTALPTTYGSRSKETGETRKLVFTDEEYMQAALKHMYS